MFRRGDPTFGEAVRALLEAMNAGGIYDHLGGGYARYSTDAEWLVPHFEKMLYDNAQILELLALVHALWPDPIVRRARPRDGRLADARDAGRRRLRRLARRRPGRRGRRVLRLDGRGDRRRARTGARPRFKAAYDVTLGAATGKAARCCAGSRRGARRRRRRTSPRARAKLFALREDRAEPGRDDKVLADWNGLTIAALVRASAVFGEPQWLRRRPRRLRLRHGDAARQRRPAPARLARRTRRRARDARRLRRDGPRGARAVRGERRTRRPRRGRRGSRPRRSTCSATARAAST